MSDGGSFDLYLTVLDEWFTSHAAHMRHPNRDAALIEGLILHYQRNPGLSAYRRCKNRTFVYKIHRPRLTPA